MIRIELEFKGKKYSVQDELENANDGLPYIWAEGNYSCDCNRALFIQRQCDPEFPDMLCDETIKLLSYA